MSFEEIQAKVSELTKQQAEMDELKAEMVKNAAELGKLCEGSSVALSGVALNGVGTSGNNARDYADASSLASDYEEDDNAASAASAANDVMKLKPQTVKLLKSVAQTTSIVKFCELAKRKSSYTNKHGFPIAGDMTIKFSKRNDKRENATYLHLDYSLTGPRQDGPKRTLKKIIDALSKYDLGQAAHALNSDDSDDSDNEW